MGDKHYHIYISSASNDVQAERLKLHYTLLQMDVFFYELIDSRSTSNTTQARKLIDNCDYAVFLLGNDYGQLSASGISYLNLDFLYALNRKKTIISFVDALPKTNKALEDDDTARKHLATLREQMKRDSQYCYEFRSLSDLERGIKASFQEAFQKSPSLGWSRIDGEDDAQVAQLQHQIKDLHQQLALSRRASVAPVVSHSADVTVDPNSLAILVNYSTQAYQDGNLHDLQLSRSLSWTQLLGVLAPHFIEPAEEATFQKVLNRYLESITLDEARLYVPRAHAVARTQIDPTTLDKIVLQMRQKDWITPPKSTSRSRRSLWRLTETGRSLTQL